MATFFKQSYLPYLLFLAGVVLIFVWARSRRVEGFGFSPSAEGFENNGKGSKMITAAPYNFEMYYVDWCPHCHTTLPEFNKLGATQTIGDKTVACKAIEAEKNPELVRGKVSGYPTIQLYDSQGKLVKEYSGQRTAQGFQTFLEDALNRK